MNPKRMSLRLSVSLLLTVGLATLSSCSFFAEDSYNTPDPTVSETLNQLPTQQADTKHLPRQLNSEQLVKLYKAVEQESDDLQQKYEVSKRLLNLSIQSAEEASMTGDVSFKGIVDELQTLLRSPASNADASALTYQLAKAQDLQGLGSDVEKSLTRLIRLEDASAITNLKAKPKRSGAISEDTLTTREQEFRRLEAHFRRAELRFSERNYQGAEADYRVVAAAEGRYQIHALYMLAWADFKLGNRQAALDAAIEVFRLLARSSRELQSELEADLLRVTVMSLDAIAGPETLASMMAEAEKPDWQMRLYRALGDYYLGKQRYEDSVKTWTRYLEENPLDKGAPEIALQIIHTYEQAGFVAQLDGLRTDFVEQYDKQSEFFEVHGEAAFQQYKSRLREYLEADIARQHAKAQRNGEPKEYLLAAAGYDRWLTNFAGSHITHQMLFLQAEALSDGGQSESAVVTYEKLLAEYPDSDHSKAAAYAVILIYEALAKDNAEKAYINERIAANRRFSRLFPGDGRALATQLKAARLAFESEQFRLALTLADSSGEISQPMQVPGVRELAETALTIAAHSRFALGDYAGAAKDYRQLLADLSSVDSATGQKQKLIRANLLASVFKQAQGAESNGDITAAIQLYRSLSDIDATAEVSVSAEYDLAMLYEQQGQVEKAMTQLVNFRQHHPKHPLIGRIPMRLVGYYEQLAHYDEAADELMLLASSNQGQGTSDQASEAIKRQAHYRAAELYLQAKDLDKAISSFRSYAHTYAEPTDLRFEAMQHMDELYLATNQTAKRDYWLRKKCEAYAKLRESEATDRIRFLAAGAAFELADQQLARFQSYSLDLPLKRTLKRKRQMMQSVIAAYKQVEAIGVYEFVTASNHRIASIYEHLGTALLASARPKGLNKLELAQYQLLLEEKAYPFEEQAIAIYQQNLQFGRQQHWDAWIDASLDALAALSPGRYQRRELEVAYADQLY